MSLEQNKMRLEYLLGIIAFEDGKEMDVCPYTEHYPSREWREMRIAWMMGWLDARTRESLGHILEKYNIGKG
jgi:ribosome modulation factor